MNTPELTVRFWGVRGSTATPGPDHMRYGGNTACIEIRCGDRRLIFDAGTGLRDLGNSIAATGAVELDLFLSHTHVDHIMGLPFFLPLYKAGNRLRLWAGHLLPERNLKDVLCRVMSPPLFPIPFEVLAADISTHDFRQGETLAPCPGIALRTAPLNHPDGATGYRVDYAGKSVCYVTDTEHVKGALDQNILALAHGADILIYDSTYTDEEYAAHEGWGHSTWQEGVKLAEAAGVKTFVVFHHDPSHDDAFMDRVAREAAARRGGTVVAREGLVLAP